jgi:putative oxidoreductase
MTSDNISALAVRYLLVMLFFPFSFLDKILNFNGAVQQAASIAPNLLAVLLIVFGIVIEITMPLAILTGTADRAAALILAGYCIITALLWKQFWATGDFWRSGESQGRLMLWDFLKNFSLAGGFLLLVVGTHGSFHSFLVDPFASSHPYMEAIE